MGIRQTTTWHEDRRLLREPHPPKPAIPRNLMDDEQFNRGFSCLRRFGLAFDAWLYHPQIDDVRRLAMRHSEVPIVIDHIGGPIRAGAPNAISQSLREWRQLVRELAGCDNVRLKIGGFGMRIAGGNWEQKAPAPSSEELAAAWQPWVETCIETFGPTRCMFESNFPVDKGSFSYTAVWNAFKRLSRQYSPEERAALFHGTAAATYRISASADA